MRPPERISPKKEPPFAHHILKGTELEDSKLCAFFLFLQLPNGSVAPEQQADANAHQPQDGEQERRAAALSGAEAPDKQAAPAPGGQKWLKHLIYQQSSGEVTHRNCEELEGVSGRKHPPLHFHRDI